jgi:hypothetical protein
LFAAAWAPPGWSQATAASALRVNVLRPFTLGVVQGGVPVRAEPLRGPGVGIFEILGAPGQHVELAFALPNALRDDRGQALDVDFDGVSAAVSPSQSLADATPVDPRLRTSQVIPPAGRLLVFVGGRIAPGASQRAAVYRATLSLTVTPLP